MNDDHIIASTTASNIMNYDHLDDNMLLELYFYAYSYLLRARAFDSLYRRYRSILYTYLYCLSRDDQVTKEIFDCIWHIVIDSREDLGIQVGRGTLNFRIYLFTHARNELLKLTTLPRPPMTELTEEVTTDSTGPLLQSPLCQKLAQLAWDEQDTFLLRRANFNVKDIAQIQNVPVPQVLTCCKETLRTVADVLVLARQL